MPVFGIVSSLPTCEAMLMFFSALDW